MPPSPRKKLAPKKGKLRKKRSGSKKKSPKKSKSPIPSNPTPRAVIEPPKPVANIVTYEIEERQKVGMHNVKEIINQNCVMHQKWTLIKDFDDICYENLLKYSTEVLDMTELTFDKEILTQKVKEAMEKGTWLVLNFSYLPVCLTQFFETCEVPKQILEPKIVFNLSEGYNVFVDREITVNQTFRLLVLSKSTQCDENIYSKLACISVDAQKYHAEKEEELLLKRTTKNKDPRVVLKEHKFIDACFEGDTKVVKKTLYEGIDPNCANPHGNTGLMEAALNGKKDICKLIINLCKLELDINAVNENKKTALHKAAYNNRAEIIKMLLLNGADAKLCDENGCMPLDYCQDSYCLQILASWDHNVTHTILQKYKEKRSDDEYQIMHCLHVSKDFKKKIIKYAFQRAKEGDIGAIKKLISKKRLSLEEQDENGATMLSTAVWSQQYECVSSLLETLGADVNTQDYKGWTPLIIAAYQNNLKMAKLLCECGAEANRRNLQGLSAIDMATSEDLKHFLNTRKQMCSQYDFEKILKFSNKEELDEYLEKEEDEFYENFESYNNVEQLEETLAGDASNPEMDKKEAKLIKRTIMSIHRCSVSDEPVKVSPKKRKKSLRKKSPNKA